MIRTFLFFFVAAISLLISTTSFAKEEVTIGMAESEFVPQEINIDQGQIVTFVNKSTADRWPASNIHPTHGIYPEFDPKRPLKPSESWSFTFDKTGTWKYHDHLLPHMRGTITVTRVKEEKQSGGILSFLNNLLNRLKNIMAPLLPQPPLSSQSSPNGTYLSRSKVEKERFADLDKMIAKEGLARTWRYIINTYSTQNGPLAHDLAHFLGGRMFEKAGIPGLSLCTPEFAFGCYHGFTESALTGSLGPLVELARACESVGKVNSGPWASCIHGIGHGVATYFDTVKLIDALSSCDRLTTGANYCHDGVFMEFAANAAQTVYKTNDPLYPCNSVEEKYQQGCGRNQPKIMQKYMSMQIGQIVKICLSSSSKTVSINCIDAIGLQIGQESSGKAETIFTKCSVINNQEALAQCVLAAAGELVFQNIPGWQTETKKACASLPPPYQQPCFARVNQTATDYGRN